MICVKTPQEIIRDQLKRGEWHVGSMRVFGLEKWRNQKAEELEKAGFEIERFDGKFANYYLRVIKIPSN